MRMLMVCVLILVMAPVVRAQQYGNVTDPALHYDFRGGWVLPPPGSGWRSQRPQPPTDAINFMRGEDPHHTWAASATTMYIDSVTSREDLSNLARLRAVEGQGKSVTLRSFEATPDSSIAPRAVRYRYQIEDRSVPYDKGKLYVLEARGVLFFHPDAPRLLASIEFSQRAEASIPLIEDAAADSFIARAALIRVDTAAVRRVDVGSGPYLIRSDAGGVWAVSPWTPEGGKGPRIGSEVLRLDPSSLEVQARAHIAGIISDLAATSDAIWACDFKNGVLLRLDRTSLATIGTVKLGGSPQRLLAAPGTLWVTDRQEGRIRTVDLSSLKPNGKQIRDLERPFQMLEAANLIWIADSKAHTVVSYEPRSRAPVGAPIPIAAWACAIAYGDSSIWILCGGNVRAIQRLDLVNRAVISTIPLGFDPVWRGSDHQENLVFAGGAVWVGNYADGTLVKVDPRTNRVTSELIGVGLDVNGMAADERGVWVADAVANAIALMPIH